MSGKDPESSKNIDGEVIVDSPSKKQVSPAKHWLFTLNNYENEDIIKIKNLDSSIVPIIVFQEENEGTPHLQGCLSFRTKGRPFNLGLSKKIHWEKKTRNSTIKQFRDYCCDPTKRIKNGEVYCRGWEFEIKFKVNIKLYDWQNEIIDIIKKTPDDRTINWFWEENGCAGKTTFCKYIYTNYHKVIVLSGKGADMKNAIVDYYKSQSTYPKIIIINIPRSSQGYVSYSGIEAIKDMFFYSGKYEGGMICGPNPHVLCFANNEPEFDMMSKDRWNVVNIR